MGLLDRDSLATQYRAVMEAQSVQRKRLNEGYNLRAHEFQLEDIWKQVSNNEFYGMRTYKSILNRQIICGKQNREFAPFDAIHVGR